MSVAIGATIAVLGSGDDAKACGRAGVVVLIILVLKRRIWMGLGKGERLGGLCHEGGSDVGWKADWGERDELLEEGEENGEERGGIYGPRRTEHTSS